jgi:hypothetical protein
MAIVGRLNSNGVMQVYTAIDELSDPTRNAGITTDGVMYADLFDENTSSEMQSNTPLRIKNDKKILAYNYFDERTLALTTDIFGALVAVSPVLQSITSVTSTNFKNVQSVIQSSHPSFNVFAVATKYYNSELLPGFGSPTGKYTFTTPGFVYNTSIFYGLSTGKEIVYMENGANYGYPEIDGKKWMAAAIYDGTTNGFRGIMLWIFTNDTINISNNVLTNGKDVIFTKNIFDVPLNPLDYMRIYQVVIDSSGNIIASDTTGNAGWGFSNNQTPSEITGYYTESNFSFDDGMWAYAIGEKVDGNDGPDYRTTNGYGFGNYNNTDPSAVLYWAGSKLETTNYVGFMFTGDA